MEFPPDVALNLARTLEQGGASETDFRVAQLTLVDLLDGASGLATNSGESISTFVASKRSSRMAAGADTQRQAFQAERQRMAQTVSRSTAELSVESKAREAAEKASADYQAQVEVLRVEERAETDQADYVALNGRRSFSSRAECRCRHSSGAAAHTRAARFRGRDARRTSYLLESGSGVDLGPLDWKRQVVYGDHS